MSVQTAQVPRVASRTRTLEQALIRLANDPCVARVCAFLTAQESGIGLELDETVLREIPAFTESGNPDIVPDLARHGAEHTSEILRLLAGGGIGDFAFVNRYAERCADQRFPLDATLHAYRCNHKVFLRWLKQATLAATPAAADGRDLMAAVADFTIEYTDVISTVAASGYVARTRLMADVAGDHRVQLLNTLLDGYDESDGRVARILREAGYSDVRLTHCVLVARSVDPAEMLNPDRARRLVDAIDEALQTFAARRVIDIRDNKVTAVLSDLRRISGWSKPKSALSTRVAARLTTLGTGVLVGIGGDVPSTAGIPHTCREAQIALEMADVTRPVIRFADVPAQRLLLQVAGEFLSRTLPAWHADFLAADAKADGALSATLEAYADADMNALKAAQQLGIHANTLYARLQRIRDATGLDGRSFRQLTELLLVAECSRFWHAKR